MELVRAVLAHSECVALFLILVLQSFAMHTINVRKLQILYKQLRTLQAKVLEDEKDDAPPER